MCDDPLIRAEYVHISAAIQPLCQHLVLMAYAQQNGTHQVLGALHRPDLCQRLALSGQQHDLLGFAKFLKYVLFAT